MISGTRRFFSQFIQNTPVRPSTLMMAGVSVLGIVTAFRLLSISSRNQDEHRETSSERIDLRNRRQPAVTVPPKIHDIDDLFKLKNQLNSIRSMRLVVPNTSVEEMRQICDILKKLHNLETLEISIHHAKYNSRCISLFFQTLSDLAPNLTYLKTDWHTHYFFEDEESEKVCTHALNQFFSECKNLATLELHAKLYSSTLDALSTCPVEKLVVDWYSLFIFLQYPNSLNNLKSLSIKNSMPFSCFELLGLYKVFKLFCQNVAGFPNLEEISIEDTRFLLDPKCNYTFVPNAGHDNENQFCNALSKCKHLKKIELQNFTFDSHNFTPFNTHYNTRLIENNHNLYWLETDVSLTSEQKEKLEKRYLRYMDDYTAKKKIYEEIEENMKSMFPRGVFNLIKEYCLLQQPAPPEVPPYLPQEVSSNGSSSSISSSSASSVEAFPSALKGLPLATELPMPATGRPIISAFEAKREEAKTLMRAFIAKQSRPVPATPASIPSVAG